MFIKTLKFIKFRALLILSLVVVILPSFLKIPIYRYIFNYSIGKNVKIGMSWIFVEKLIIGDYVVIRHFNRFKNIPEVRIGSYCIIGNGNYFTSTKEFICEQSLHSRNNKPLFSMEEYSSIGMLHYFDVQDTLTIGTYTTIAGIGSAFFTHQLDIKNSQQSTKPIAIGKYCMVGSNARFVPGSKISDYCVVGMGTVVTKQFTKKYCLIGGNPAQVIRNISETSKYFSRTYGWVSSFTYAPYPHRRG